MNIIERPISAFSKCLLGINSNKYKNCSIFCDNESVKIVSDDSKLQNMNSDIINLI